MTPSEARTLGGSAVVLVAASVVRLGLAMGAGPPIAPAVEDALPALVDRNAEAEARHRRRSRPLEAGERIDVNEADSIELQRLPRVGPALARRIVEERESGGWFREPNDLTRVTGIGPKTVERLRSGLRFAGPSRNGRPVHGARSSTRTSLRPGARDVRIDPNRAGPAELQRLPGVGPELARRIVEHRERSGAFNQLDDLLKVTGIGPRKLESMRSALVLRR